METLEFNDLLRFFDSGITGPVRKGGYHFYHYRHNIFELNHSCILYFIFTPSYRWYISFTISTDTKLLKLCVHNNNNNKRIQLEWRRAHYSKTNHGPLTRLTTQLRKTRPSSSLTADHYSMLNMTYFCRFLSNNRIEKLPSGLLSNLSKMQSL